MQNYKDTNNKVHVLDDVAFEHLLPAGCVRVTQEEADELSALPAPSLAQLKSAELSALFSSYQADMQSLQALWLSALIADGSDETERRDDVAIEMSEVKAQYVLDVAAVKLKYLPQEG